jgi:3-methyl-2-oxobutanoate hydroxymethyltransferase
MSSHPSGGPRAPVTIQQLARWKQKGRRLVAVTAYDYTMARLVERAQVDVVLVGDSLGNVVQGLDTTLPVTLEDVIYHSRAVRRALTHAHLVGDMPFMTYQVSVEQAMRNAGQLMKEGGVQSVKLEGGRERAEAVRRLVEAGIPVMGHVGLTPQSVHQLGGYRVQGRGDAAARRLLEDASILEEAGAYAVVLECVPARLAQQVTSRLSIPTIGIGAGPHCDGQILVLPDLLGLNDDFKPRFVRRFAELGERVVEALERYAAEVKSGSFPAAEETFDPSPSLAVVHDGG